MPRCPQCGRLVSIHQQSCPHCDHEIADPEDPTSAGELLEVRELADLGPQFGDLEVDEDAADSGENEDDHARRVPIARFQSGAEVGYFADELAREAEIDARVLAREHFDAVHGVASTDYVLLTFERDAERAARILRELVDSTEDHEPRNQSAHVGGSQDREDDYSSGVPAAGGAVWVPILLTLAAGSIAYWGVERVEQRPRPPALINGGNGNQAERRQPPELWRALGTSRSPWVQKLGAGPGIRMLEVDPISKSALIQEDSDGDGRFERQWEFSLHDDP